MSALTDDEITRLDTPSAFTDVFRAQVGELLDMDLSKAANLPMSGTSHGKNIFAAALAAAVPEDIYSAEAFAGGEFAPWVYRFGFTPRALNMYASNYDRVHEPGAFPKAKFIQEIRRAKNCGYKKRSRQRSKGDISCRPTRRGCPPTSSATPPSPNRYDHGPSPTLGSPLSL